MKTSKRLSFIATSLLVLVFSFPAFAVLGGDESSIATDTAQMKATVRVTQSQRYTAHELKAESGTFVREYLSPEGRVFGVAWQGPFIPDMEQLLGTYLQQYSAGVKAHHAAGAGRRPLNIQQPDLVLHTSGHMRSYSGIAYDPRLLPQGVTASDIR